MPRQRTELGHDVDTEIRARTERGESARTIAEALRRPELTRTIARRQQELRGAVPASTRAAPPAAPGGGPTAPLARDPAGRPPTLNIAADDAPDVPEDPPAGTPLEQIDRWIQKLEGAARTAEAHQNFAALASIAAKVASLMSLRHKATPLPKADLNEHPDYKALAAKGREWLEQAIHGVFEQSGQ